MTARRALITALLALLAAASCLSVPDGPTTMCSSDNDCTADGGYTCEEGTCWGNPPVGPFSAVLSPPSTRRDLVPRELPSIDIPINGQLGTLTVPSSVLMGGVVTTDCPQAPCDTIGATITVTRKPQFSGGPGFKTVVNVDAKLGFAIPVLSLAATDDPYVLTVVSDSGHPVPPLRLATTVGGATMKLTLGDSDLPVLSGTLTDSTGQGLRGYRVAALGRWDQNEPATEVSSVMTTDSTGAYAVTLSDNLIGTVELVASAPPPDDNNNTHVGPTVHISNIDATRSSTHSAIAASTLGSEQSFTVHVIGLNSFGAVSDVVGATATVSASTGATTSFAVSDTRVTDSTGVATFKVLGGPDLINGYTISIVPPPNSNLGALFEKPQTVPAPSGPGDVPSASPIRLGNRVTVLGFVVDRHGAPVLGALVTAKPALRFLWALPTVSAQSFVGAIPAATAATGSDGSFTMTVDAEIASTWGSYDLAIDPPAGSDQPAYVQQIDVVRNAAVDTLSVGTIQLPAPARIHGTIVGADHKPIKDAEIKVYYVQTQQDLCTQFMNAPKPCTIPASLLGRNTSADTGVFRVSLPRATATQ